MGGGGGGGTTTSNILDPRFSPLIDYATQSVANVNAQGYVPYTGDRFAGLSGNQQAGIDMIANRATGGDPTMRQATSTLQNTLQGGNTNPYLDAMVQKSQDSVIRNMNQQAARSGSFGNSGIAQAGAEQMGDIATQMYGNAYNTDRANQMAALSLAPTYGNQAYSDAAQLMKVGQTQQDQEQQARDFAYQQFQDRQNDPYKKMAAYSGLLGASSATAQTQTTQDSGGK